jgi:hypothetical protein
MHPPLYLFGRLLEAAGPSYPPLHVSAQIPKLRGVFARPSVYLSFTLRPPVPAGLPGAASGQGSPQGPQGAMGGAGLGEAACIRVPQLHDGGGVRPHRAEGQATGDQTRQEHLRAHMSWVLQHSCRGGCDRVLKTGKTTRGKWTR